MIIYVIFFIFILLIAIQFPLKSKEQKEWVLLITVLLIVLAAFRGIGVDVDSETYFEAFNNIKSGESVPIDMTFIVLTKALPYFSLLVALYAVAGVILKIIGIMRMSPFPLISILVYYSHFYFLHEFTQIRGGIAAGLLLWEIYCLVKGLKKRAVIALIFAFLFHSSAILGILFFYIDSKKNNLYKYIYIFIIALALLLVQYSILNIVNMVSLGSIGNKIQLYIKLLNIGQQSTIHIFNVAFFFQLFVGFCSILLCKKNLGNQYTLILTKIYWIGLTLYLFFSPIPVIAFRLSELCLVGEYILFPQIIYLFKPKVVSKSLVFSMATCIFILYVFLLKSVNPYMLNI